MIVPVLITAGVLGLLALSRTQKASAPMLEGTPGTMPGVPPPVATSTPAPIAERMGEVLVVTANTPSGNRTLRVGDTVRVVGMMPQGRTGYKTGYLLTPTPPSAVQSTAANEVRLVAPGSLTVMWWTGPAKQQRSLNVSFM